MLNFSLAEGLIPISDAQLLERWGCKVDNFTAKLLNDGGNVIVNVKTGKIVGWCRGEQIMSRQLLTISELASVLSCSRGGIYHYKNLPPAYESSRGKFWSADEIRAWMYSHVDCSLMKEALARLNRLTRFDDA